MSIIQWDQVGERRYETGIDRGVLYLPDSAVPWNGLTSVVDGNSRDKKEYYIDGRKYLDYQVPGNFTGHLKAFTYPDEFDLINGSKEFSVAGVLLQDQRVETFGLTYRTRIGNDADGIDHGYKLHILYNLKALPSDITYATLGLDQAPNEFDWELTATPESADGFRATAHVIFDSTMMIDVILGGLEDILYGTTETEPSLPPLQDLLDTMTTWNTIIITDLGDGRWTAVGPDDLITMLDETTFQIDEVDATYLDADTYTISSTLLYP